MAACSHTADCALFPMISVSSALKVWRTFYCEGKWHECARFKLSLEGKPVPPNLLPNGKVIDLNVGKPQGAAKPAPVAAPAPAPATTATAAQPAVSVASAAAASGDTRSYYLRMQIQPGAGTIMEIIRLLGQGRVRIDAVTEKKGLSEGTPSYLIVLTDQVDEPTLNQAVTGLQGLACVLGEVKRVALERMAQGQLV